MLKTKIFTKKSTKPLTLAEASQWKLIWNSFRHHRLAVIGLVIISLLYFIALFAEFLAPFDPMKYDSQAIYHPPQRIYLIDVDTDGSKSFRPHVISHSMSRDPRTLRTIYQPNPQEKIYLTLFGKGDSYLLWGLFQMDRHLITTEDPTERVYFVGADRLGRDVLSRTILATRISMTVGLVGVISSLIIGIILGGISGYFGGIADSIIQRIIEMLLAIPTIPLWLGLSAAMPRDWSPVTRYFAITVILSLVGWTRLARVVRGKILALKTEDFVAAARLDGGSQSRIIFRHIMPSITSHIIAAVTLAIPAMIIAETSLSFLGLGLLPPTISWGVLLLEVQNLPSLLAGPWLFFPATLVIIAVLSFNFVGDGLRDAADPYVFMGR